MFCILTFDKICIFVLISASLEISIGKGMRDMNTEFLRSFLDVVETGSFTRSACRLHVSQSTISGRVQELEREVGQTLLTRLRGRVEQIGRAHV